jgi:hypothetical protein
MHEENDREVLMTIIELQVMNSVVVSLARVKHIMDGSIYFVFNGKSLKFDFEG